MYYAHDWAKLTQAEYLRKRLTESGVPKDKVEMMVNELMQMALKTKDSDKK